MPLSLYDVTIPVFVRAFGNLSANLAKAKAFADEKGMPHEELLNARLIDDMLPLTAQIQRASDSARFVAVRVGQFEAKPMEDKEASFADLEARIAATVAYLKSVPSGCMDGREEMEVVVKFGSRTVEFTGRDYVLGFAIPNFYFHATTAYAILRHKGVPLGKLDFLGGR